MKNLGIMEEDPLEATSSHKHSKHHHSKHHQHKRQHGKTHNEGRGYAKRIKENLMYETLFNRLNLTAKFAKVPVQEIASIILSFEDEKIKEIKDSLDLIYGAAKSGNYQWFKGKKVEENTIELNTSKGNFSMFKERFCEIATFIEKMREKEVDNQTILVKLAEIEMPKNQGLAR